MSNKDHKGMIFAERWEVKKLGKLLAEKLEIDADTNLDVIPTSLTRANQSLPPLKPIDEQKKIVENIDYCYSHLDESINALNSALEDVKKCRQSLEKIIDFLNLNERDKLKDR